MTEERFSDLESRIAFQEHALHALHEEVYRQQREIERLQQLLRRAAERLTELADHRGAVGDAAAEPPPPHY